MLNVLNVAQTGLHAAQVQVEGVMNNLANENTPGYKSRVVNVSELDHSDSRLTGRGINVDDISRVTNVYMYQNLVEEESKLSSFTELDVMLNDIESIFYETDDSGLSADINRYFQSIENLRTSPQNEIYKDDLKNNASILVDDMKRLYEGIEQRETGTLSRAEDTVEEINSILTEIGAVSQEIIDSVGTPNDLYDKRDALEHELANYIDVEIARENSYELKIGGVTAVRFDTNVHSLNLVETYTPQNDVYVEQDIIPYVSSLIDTATWDNSGATPDSITYVLNNETSINVEHGETISSPIGTVPETYENIIVDETNTVRALVTKINTNIDMLGKITAYNGQYELDIDGNKILTNNPLHSDYDIADPNKDRYLVVESTIDGEKGKFVGEVLVYDNDNIDGNGDEIGIHVSKDSKVSKEGIDDIHLEIFDEEIYLTGGILKPMIDNLKTESGLNNFTEYKEKLDQFAKTLSDLSESFIENEDETYVYGLDASEIHANSDDKILIGLFTGANVESLQFHDSMVNTLSQQKLDYLASIQWKDDIDFTGTGQDNTSFSKFYQTLRVGIADDRETIIFKKESQGAIKEAMQSTYDKLTKVDKDKEMVDLIKFQAAYEANAKMITIVDEMLTTILGMKR